MAEQTYTNESEEWRDVPGWEGLYRVSNLGRVITLPRQYRHRSGRIVETVSKVLKGGVNSIGYVATHLRRKDRIEPVLVHRLVCEAFHGPGLEGQEVAHSNGIRSDNRSENLRWATRKENMNDKLAHGTAQRGEKNPKSKLNEAQVMEIRSNPEIALIDFAEKYSVDISCVWKARHRRTWKHI